MGQGSLPAKGSYREMARIEPEQRPEICIFQQDLGVGNDCSFRPTKSTGNVIGSHEHVDRTYHLEVPILLDICQWGDIRPGLT